MKRKIPINYKQTEEEAKKKYPGSVDSRYAFKAGVFWAIENIYKNKTRDDIFDEMEIPRITLD